MKYVMMVVTLSVACMLGCSKSGSSGGSTPGHLVQNINFNLSQTNSMYVAPVPGTSQGVESESANGGLFAMNNSAGTVDRITLTAEQTESSQTVFNTPNFLALQVSNVVDANGTICLSVIVAKATGQTYCLTDGISANTDFYKSVQTDSTGTLMFYLDESQNLVELNTTSWGQQTIAGGVHGFTIDANGDALVDIWTGDTVSTNLLYFYPIGGGSQLVSTKEVGSLATIDGPGASNTFYYASSPADCGSAYCELVISGGTFAKQVAGITIPICLSGEGCSFAWAGTTMVESTTPTQNLNWFFTSTAQIDMVPSGTPANNITGATPTEIMSVAAATGAVMIHALSSTGLHGMYRYNTGTGIFDTVMTAGAYTVSSFDINSNGDVTISATRTSDGANVMATVASGTTTVNVVTTTPATATALAVLQ